MAIATTMHNHSHRLARLILIKAVALAALFSSQVLAIESPDSLTGNIRGTTASLEWSAVSGATGYNLYRNDGYLTTINSTSYQDVVESGQVYHYYVVAFDDEPEYSLASEKLTLPRSAVPDDLTIPPSVPSNLTGDIEGTSVQLSWQASTDDESVAGYNVYRNNQYLTTVHDPEYVGTVIEGETYVFTVAAFDIRQNFSAISDGLFLPLSAEPPDPNAPPSQPTELVGTIEGNSVSLTWAASTDNQLVQGYNVYRNNNYVTTVATPIYEGVVDVDTFYTFSIVAFDNDGNFSVPSDTLLLPDTGEERDTTNAPDVVIGLSVELGESTDDELAITVSWNPSEDDFGVAGYNIYQNNSYLTTVDDTHFETTVSLDDNTNWYVVAFDFDGNFSAASDKIRYPDNGPDTAPPSQPANLAGTLDSVEDELHAILEWDASSDNIAVLGYNVYQNNAYVTTVYDTTYTLDVLPDAVNSFFVVAFDDSNNFSTPSQRINLPETENIAPTFFGLEDVTIFAGETLSLEIRPIDADGDAPGLFAGPLPEGMSLTDNQDGSRTLRWQVLEPQVGHHTIELTAMDAADPAVTTTVTLTITVELPDDLTTIPNLPPGLNLIEGQLVRAGDNVIMRVKGTDPNGTIPLLTMIDPPTDSTFEVDPEDEAFSVLRWQTPNNVGTVDLHFLATDQNDEALTTEMVVTLDILDPAFFERTGPRLRELASSHGLSIGYAQVLRSYENPDADLYRDIASEEFNIVTAENSMKWGYINPEPGVYRWDSADDLIAFAASNQMKVRGHTLVWYTVLPQWVIDSDEADREALMLGFIDDMTDRYPDVDVWDVVNEALEADGSFRQSIWFEAMGESYIATAFEHTRAKDDDAELIYNDYDIGWENPKSDAAYQLMQNLQGAGIPIDGIGFQFHVSTAFDQYESVRENFRRFAALNLNIHITEMDVSMLPGDTLEDQANVYREILTICLEEPACNDFQLWGYTDRYSWLSNADPLIFDREYQAKPAYYEMQDVLMGN